MKLIFFLIAFSLVSIRVYFSWAGKDRERKGESESNMVIRSDNFYEEIKYSGKFQLTDDETGFKSISPGGYFKFRKNEVSIKAESNLQGLIEYRINDGSNNVPLDERGKKILAEAIREMIVWGFDAENRMERVYRKGGAQALLSEVDSMRSDHVRLLYLNRLFAIDSLIPQGIPIVIIKAGALGSDVDKVNFLTRITAHQLKDSLVDSAYFEVVKKISSDMDKANALQYLIEQDSLSAASAEKALALSGEISSDVDKANLFGKMIEKGLIRGPLFDSLLYYISAIGSDVDKVNLYEKLLTENGVSDLQWAALLNKSSLLESDMDKTNLLISISQKMPHTETLKENYRKAAKTIGNDSDYGRAVRAMD